MEPKWSPKRVKTEFENEQISGLAFSSFSSGFGEAKVVENHPKSLPGGARKRKRAFSENVGFIAVKPSFSRPEASRNEDILEKKSLRALVAAQGRKHTPKKCDFR